MRSIIIFMSIFFIACTAASEPSQPPVHAMSPAPVPAPEPSVRVGDPIPIPTMTESPSPCDNARFTESGLHVVDNQSGRVWYGTDAADYSKGFDANTVCQAQTGMRAATTAEVLELTGLVLHPTCRLPTAFHGVYAWADLDFFPKSPLPINTSDGCVDLYDGVAYKGKCTIGVDVSRSAMCVQ